MLQGCKAISVLLNKRCSGRGNCRQTITKAYTKPVTIMPTFHILNC